MNNLLFKIDVYVNSSSTAFTTLDSTDASVHYKTDRPFLIISSTSWTGTYVSQQYKVVD